MGLVPKNAKKGSVIKLPPLFKGVTKEPLKIEVIDINDAGTVQGVLTYFDIPMVNFLYDRKLNKVEVLNG